MLLQLIFVGSYFTKVTFDPFISPAPTLGPQPNNSGNWKEAFKSQEEKNLAITTIYPVYFLDTVEAAKQLE